MHASPHDRRAWRLAYLLSGDGDAAARIVSRVRRAQPRPQDLEPARLDRLVVLTSREIAAPSRPNRAPRPAAPASGLAARASGLAARAHAAALALPRQPREAWVLTRIDELDELWVSRAMDCSRTASGHHLQAADRAMAEKLGDQLAPATQALRDFADSIDPGVVLRQHRRLRRRTFRRRALAAALIAAIALLAALVGWLRLAAMPG